MIRTLLGLTVLGAVLAALGMFCYQGFVLIQAGVARDRVPFDRLVLDVMDLDRFAAYGAAAGAVLAVVVLAVRAVAGLAGGRSRAAGDGATDPDRIIKAHRARLAEEYMARRRAERGRAGAARGDGSGTP